MRLEERFHDKNPPFSDTEAGLEANRCLYCHDAPCIRACPTAIDIPTFIRRIATGNSRGAARTILTANLLGASCARVCPVEVLCEGSCVYNNDDRRPVAIGRLQRHATDHGGGPEILAKAAESSGLSVGLVGAGPASLACAGQLALLGHRPVLYEKNAFPGGLNTTGVAPYKLVVEDAIAEAESIVALGVELRVGVTVGQEVTSEQLLTEHAAVFLGPGLGPDSSLSVPGEDGPGVVGAVAWIERMKTQSGFSIDEIQSAVVVGGGNTAVDVARELRGLGVESVVLAYRRGEHEMKAYAHELDGAKREGAVLMNDVAVSEVIRTSGQVTAVRLMETESGRPTDRERDIVPADLVVLAIGQSKLRSLAKLFPGVECDDKGRIVANPATGATGNPRVFTGGDAMNGGKEVVNAAHDGQLAARSMDRLFREGATVTDRTEGGSDG